MQTMECSIFIVQRNASLEEDILMQWRTTQQKSQCLEMVQHQGECSLFAYFPIYFIICISGLQRRRKTKRLSQWPDLNAKQRNNKSGMKLLHHTHFGPRMPAFRGDLFLCEDYCTYTQKCNITYYVPFLSSEWKSSQNFFFRAKFQIMSCFIIFQVHNLSIPRVHA